MNTDDLDFILLIDHGMGCSMDDQSVLGYKKCLYRGKQSLKILYDGLGTHEKRIL